MTAATGLSACVKHPLDSRWLYGFLMQEIQLVGRGGGVLHDWDRINPEP
jgi:hypothetical protein